MPYQTGVPNASQSPGLFPNQGQDNFTRLKAIIGSNHKFNDSAATDDGYHQNIKMLPLTTPGNDATVGQSFVNSADATNQLWFKDGLNRVFQITPTIPIYAAVSFYWDGAAVQYRYRMNVSTVTRISTGIYRINFTVAMANTNYIVAGNGMHNTSSGSIVEINPDTVVTNSITTTFVKIRTVNTSNSERDLLSNMVVVMGG